MAQSIYNLDNQICLDIHMTQKDHHEHIAPLFKSLMIEHELKIKTNFFTYMPNMFIFIII